VTLSVDDRPHSLCWKETHRDPELPGCHGCFVTSACGLLPKSQPGLCADDAPVEEGRCAVGCDGWPCGRGWHASGARMKQQCDLWPHCVPSPISGFSPDGPVSPDLSQVSADSSWCGFWESSAVYAHCIGFLSFPTWQDGIMQPKWRRKDKWGRRHSQPLPGWRSLFSVWCSDGAQCAWCSSNVCVTSCLPFPLLRRWHWDPRTVPIFWTSFSLQLLNA
jgi:hypothetical protein